MKIGHIVLSLGLGGAEKLLVDNLPLYKEKGHDISLIQLSSKLEEKTYIEHLKSKGVEVITLGKSRFSNPIFFFKLKKILNKKKFDIVHVHLFPNLYYLAFLKKLKLYNGITVFTEHSTKNGRTNIKFFNLIEPHIYKHYDKIIAISNNVKNYLETLLPNLKYKIIIINNGIDVSKYRNAMTYDISQFVNNNAKKSDFTLLLMVSRFSDPKDQLSLIKALEYISEEYILLLVGEGDKMEECKNAAKKYGNRVLFLGFRNDIPELMKTVDINILSSDYEGFSGVTLESLSSGVPFLGSNVKGINDIVPNEDFLFKAGDSKDIANKIIRISENENYRNKLIEDALNHVSQFDSRVMIEKHLEIYSELLENKK